MTILITGGAGYIGSHTCIELLNAGSQVVVFDNFCNSSPEAVRRVEQVTGKLVRVVSGDIRDRKALENAMRTYSCEAVIHFAGLKDLNDSLNKPLEYYDNNVIGTIQLLEAMQEVGVKSLVFSSTAAVYGQPECLPISEDHALAPTNPYGRSKHMIEEILHDWHRVNPSTQIAILRYFNPVGAHRSGLIGEDPCGIPTNLMPYVAQVASGMREYLNIWGNDFPTHDGTGVRDYIHVVDLAVGHLKALEYLKVPQCITLNLGTGKGSSVYEVLHAFECASSIEIPYKIGHRRPNDVASCYADVTRAETVLGWKADYDLGDMCRDHWRWQRMNPYGYSPNKLENCL